MKRCIFLGAVLLFGLFCARMGYAATYDATGQWDMHPFGFETNCDPPPPQRPDSTVYLMQNGNTATVVDVVNTNTLLGTVSGATYTFQDIWYEWDSGGLVTENIVITASSSTQGSGTDNWTWASGSDSCSGHYNMSLTRRPQDPATYNATGTWQYTTSGFYYWCDQATPPPASGTLTITQTGNRVTAVTVIDNQQVQYDGYVSGSTYTFVRSYPDSGGTVSQVIRLTLYSSGSGSGSCNWVWDDAYDDCGGGFNIAITRSGFTISASAGPGGSISPSGSFAVPYNGNQTFTISPNPGYRVQDVLVDGVSVGSVRTYTFTNVQADHTIEALFGKSAAMPWLQLLLGE